MNKHDLDSMSAIISNAIGLSLNDRYKKVRLHANDDLSNISSSYTKYKKQIQELEDELNKFNQYMESLDKVTGKVNLSASSDNTEKIIKLIDKKLRTKSYIEKKIQATIDTNALIESLYKVNKNSKMLELVEGSKDLLNRYKLALKQYNERIHNFVKKQRPPILSEKLNKAVKYIISFIEKNTEKYPDIALSLDKSTYSIGLSKNNNSICCIRFIPMTKVPLVNNKVKDMYLVLGVNLPNPEFNDKNNLVSSESSHLMVCLVDDIIPVEKLPKMTFVENTRDVKKAFELFAHYQKLAIFGYEIDKEKFKAKREEQKSNLNILGNEKIRMKITNPYIVLGIPKELVKLEGKNLSADTNQDIIDDLIVITGLSENESNGEITRFGKIREENSLIIVQYKILSVDENELNHFNVPNDNLVKTNKVFTDDNVDEDVDRKISKEDKIGNSKEDINKFDKQEDVENMINDIQKNNYREQFNLNEFED